LPSGAELNIGGLRSQLNPAVREFETPPLVPGKNCSYPLKAVWKDGDKEFKCETTIIVRAGVTTIINNLQLKPSAPNAEATPATKLVWEMDVTRAPRWESKAEQKPQRKPESIKETKSKASFDPFVPDMQSREP
jgi:uncharacterized protein (TIGR03000 family)